MQTNRKAVVATIGELITQPYALDPGSLEYLVEESLRLDDGATRVVCLVLGVGALSLNQRENLEAFIRRAIGSIAARRSLLRCVERRGRCPAAERAWLRRVLTKSDQNEAPAYQSVSRASYSQLLPKTATSNDAVSAPQAPAAAVLDLHDLTGAIDQLPELLSRLASLPRPINWLKIRLGPFTYSAALSVLAQFLLAEGLVSRHSFVDCPLAMRGYLDNLQFGDALTNPQIKVSPDPMDWAVGLTRINRELSTERVTDKIVDILTTFINPQADDRSALSVMIAEMIENVHRHAKAPVDGFAVAQVYPKNLKMGITLVDAGIGVRASFETGEPSIPITHLTTDAEFLATAIRLHATSKSENHSGYGLYLLSELISRNRGTFLLASGGATLIGYRREGRLFLESFEHRPWRGTIVSVIIDLTQSLPLSQIYREMPLPEGIESDEELFNG